MTTKTRTAKETIEERKLDELINNTAQEFDTRLTGLYAGPYVPSLMPPLEDMTQQADLPPTTVYGVNEELGGDLEYDVDESGRVDRIRRQPPEAKGDEADLGPLTLEAYWEKARTALDLRDIALSDKARATSSKKAYDDAAKIVDQLGRQIREFGHFGAKPKAAAPTLFDKPPVDKTKLDADYESFMGEPRPSEPESVGE